MLWLILVAAIIVLIYIKHVKVQNYWKVRNVNHVKPKPFIGNMGPFTFGKCSLAELLTDIYNSYPNGRYIGFHQFLQPTLMITDVDLTKQIAIKDFEHFTDRRTFVSEEVDPLFGKSLFALDGQKWKTMRTTLTPAFTGSKMKVMFKLISEMGKQLNNHLTKIVDSEQVVTMEVKDLFTRFANDVIATSAFGIKCNSLEERDNEFYHMGLRTLFDGFVESFKLFAYTLSPAFMKFFSIKIFNSESARFFRNITLSTMKIRTEQGIVRHDMLQLLIEARKNRLEELNSNEGNKDEILTKYDLTDDDVSAQVLIFFFAGFETTSTLLCHMANELAQNEDVQRKLQNEIDETIENLGGKELTYEAIIEMKYLDMVISETLRLWPSTPLVDRKCVKPYVIQPANVTEKPLHIQKGDIVLFPIYSVHRNPKYFSDPNRFDPERFSDENKSNIKQFSYFPFGIGPRSCIGTRFALLEAKVVYFYLLSKFNLTVVKETQIPFKMKRFQFNVHAENGFWVGLKARK